MPIAPTNTYGSNTDLALGHVPQVEDPVLYNELLDIHNAIETLIKSSDEGSALPTAVITVTEDYTIQVGDGTIRVDASAGVNIIITLPPATGSGRRYEIKKINGIPLARVVLVGDGTQLVDGRADGIRISLKSSYTVKDVGTGWDII